MSKIKVIEGVDYIKVPSWDKDIEIIIPLTNNGSKKYGMYTSWCTAVNSPFYFNDYTKRGIFVYFIMKNEIIDWETTSGEIVKTTNKYAWFKSFDDYDDSWWNINDDEIRKPFNIPHKSLKFINNKKIEKQEQILKIEEKNKNIKQKLIDGEKLNDDEIHYDGDLDLRGNRIKSLGNLESVGGKLNLLGTPIKSLGNLKSVGGFLNLWFTQIKDLGSLESVGSRLDLSYTPIKSLGKLKYVGDVVHLEGTNLTPEDFKNIKVDGGFFENN